MAAYVIVDIDVLDTVRYEAYKELAAPAVTAHGGRYLARGGAVEILEGLWSPKRLVILEFPSAERAREWWTSEEYAPAKKIRQATARTEMVLIDGV